MSEEWTVSTIDEWISLNPTTWRSVIAFERNAALAAVLEEYRDEVRAAHVLQKQLDASQKLYHAILIVAEQQAKELAAERENVQPLVDALKLLADDGPLIDYRAIARTALAKAGK